MRTLYFMSLVSAIMSLVCAIGFSAITIAPGPGAEAGRARLVLLAVAFFVAWLCLALWVRIRKRSGSPPALPKWVETPLILVSFLYCLVVLFSVIA